MSTKPNLIGIEPKHITYLKAQDGTYHDMLVVKEVGHFDDGSKRPRLKLVEDYKRPFWITQKGQQTHRDKRDFEYVKNTRKYTSTQIDLTRSIVKVTGDYSAGPNPPLRRIARSPYVYGTDVSSSCLIKHDYREKYGKLFSMNRVAAGDVETNVFSKEEEIILLSVTCKKNATLLYLKEWIGDIPDLEAQTHQKADEFLKGLLKERDIQLEVVVCDTPAEIVVEGVKRLHRWKPDFFTFWNMDFDIRHMVADLERGNIDPKDVFSDPSIPERYKYFEYKQGPTQKVTASGKSMSINIEDRWNWVTHPAQWQTIDSLPIYRNLRLAKGKDSSYTLDYILSKELSLNHSKKIESHGDAAEFLQEMEDKLNINPSVTPEWKIVRKPSTVNENDIPLGATVTCKFINTKNIPIVLSMRVTQDKDIIEFLTSVDTAMGEAGVINKDCTWSITQKLKAVTVDDIHIGDDVSMSGTFGKLKFDAVKHLSGLRWHEVMQTKYKIEYAIYNLFDSLALELLDEKTNDLGSNISLFAKHSDYKIFNSSPKRLCDDMHFWHLRREEPEVIGSSSDDPSDELDPYVVSHGDWIVTLPSFMAAPNGATCVKEFPDYKTLIFTHVADLDKRLY